MALEFGSTSLASDSAVVVYWKLEDTSDSKGSNTLTNNGAIVFNPAKFNNGGDLGTANSSKWLDIPTDVGIAGNQDISISGWIKLSDEIASGIWGIFKHQSTNGAVRYFQLDYLYNSGTQQLQLNGAGNSVTFNVALGTSTYHHIVITRNVSGNETKLYVDDVLQVTGTIGTGTIGSSLVSLGGNGGNYTSAIFDDVVVFNRVLLQADVDIIYNGTPATTTSTSTSTSTTSTSSSTTTSRTTSTSTSTTQTSSSTSTTSTSTSTTSTSTSTTSTSTSTTSSSTSMTSTSTSRTTSTSITTSTTVTLPYHFSLDELENDFLVDHGDN